MKLHNYTSTVPVEKSVASGERLLVEAGATHNYICSACKGTGSKTGNFIYAWIPCPVCNGAGEIKGSAKETSKKGEIINAS